MDQVLQAADRAVFTEYVYPKDWAEDDPVRQALSLFMITLFGGYFLYLSMATFSYHYLFDKELLKHPRVVPNQVQLEMKQSLLSIPWMTLLTVPFFWLEVRGYTKLYDRLDEYSWNYTVFSVFCFIMWNDCIIYWVHRWLHLPSVYKRLHKQHHKWVIPTPYASHAMHPLDGWSQGLSYHLFVFVMPLHKWIYLAAFLIVNAWTVDIHSEVFERFSTGPLRWLVNGPSHHTEHHMSFTCNLGQYFTIWDRIGGTYKVPGAFVGNGPRDQLDKLLGKKKET